MSRRAIIASIVTLTLVVAASLGGYRYFYLQRQKQLDRDARLAAVAFADAWSRRAVREVNYQGRTPAEMATSFTTATAGLGKGPVEVTLSTLNRSGDAATGTIEVVWTLTPEAIWKYTLPLVLAHTKASGWLVVPREGSSMWAPNLSPSAKLTLKRTWGTRGAVLDRHGEPILQIGTVYDIAIDPVRAGVSTIEQLEQLLGEPPGSLVAKTRASTKGGSRAPVPVITYREADFLAIKDQLDALKGVIYPRRTQPLAPSPTFARPLLGSYGAVTADTVKASKGRLKAGDFAGLSGLQSQYDAVLAGTPGLSVLAVEPAGSTPAGTTTAAAATDPLFEVPPVDGTPLSLTLDIATQKAAEQALIGTGSVPSALVAVDVTTGDLLAVANAPSFGFNRALLGQYQPGSTLKVATTYALLKGGLTAATPVACPPTLLVDGRTIRNFEGETFATAPFSKDFALSCNTAFAHLAGTLGPSEIHDAAAALGIGGSWGKHLGVSQTFAGSVPATTTATEQAATAFGQARTLVSPAALAVMAASVARGSYIEPALISDPAVEGADREPQALDAATTQELRSLMRLVVTSGTGTALNSVVGGPVAGKTGTAEFGGKTPPQTRAWFIGWQGHVAFAVLVEEGRSGGAVAAPIARAFLENLHG